MSLRNDQFINTLHLVYWACWKFIEKQSKKVLAVCWLEEEKNKYPWKYDLRGWSAQIAAKKLWKPLLIISRRYFSVIKGPTPVIYTVYLGIVLVNMYCCPSLKNYILTCDNNIPAFLVVDCIICQSEPLSHLFNLILKSCLYPEVWKTSRVLPVHKSADEQDIKNYRPIIEFCKIVWMYNIWCCLLLRDFQNCTWATLFRYKDKSTVSCLYE